LKVKDKGANYSLGFRHCFAVRCWLRAYSKPHLKQQGSSRLKTTFLISRRPKINKNSDEQKCSLRWKKNLDYISLEKCLIIFFKSDISKSPQQHQLVGGGRGAWPVTCACHVITLEC